MKQKKKRDESSSLPTNDATPTRGMPDMRYRLWGTVYAPQLLAAHHDGLNKLLREAYHWGMFPPIPDIKSP